ncbi:DNA repair protein Rad60 [Lutzomyia longipalpis]|uniref:DNA repair protein Rad60 n=1 Tax=Lutzomyia longipalpis TaxID=7200 RepID=UPI002483D609|nr:DNA repair protein Rad60 [Lutzomyia longipalpis]
MQDEQDDYEDFDILSNLNNLNNDPVPMKFSNDPENPSDQDDIDDFPDSPGPQTKNLSNTNEKEMSKKEQQLMKRYKKKLETVQKQIQKKQLKETKNQPQGKIRKRRVIPGEKISRRRTRRNPGSPQIVDYITIGAQDMDEDYKDCPRTSESSGQSSSNNDIDYEITIKLKWKEQIERIPFRYLQSFRVLFENLSKKEGVAPNMILLLMEDRIVAPTDTPSSIGYTSIDFISGRVVQPNMLTVVSPKKLHLKIQSDQWRKPLAVTTEKTDKIEDLLKRCALELKCATDEINLRFDGEILNSAMTLQDLELEGGELIDCVFNTRRQKRKTTLCSSLDY